MTIFDNSGIQYRPSPGGVKVAFNVTAATQIKPSQGVVFRVFVNTAPRRRGGGVYDMADGGTAGADNLIAAIPAAAGIVEIIAPFYKGLYIDPGTDGVVSVSYE